MPGSTPPIYLDNNATTALDPEALPVWRELFLTRTRDEWLETFAGLEACVGPVNDFAEANDDPQLRHREMVVEAEHPTEGTVRQVAPPFKLREHPAAIGGPPPRLGPGHGTPLHRRPKPSVPRSPWCPASPRLTP